VQAIAAKGRSSCITFKIAYDMRVDRPALALSLVALGTIDVSYVGTVVAAVGVEDCSLVFSAVRQPAAKLS
jgi:hypothetical protein